MIDILFYEPIRCKGLWWEKESEFSDQDILHLLYLSIDPPNPLQGERLDGSPCLIVSLRRISCN